MTDRELMQQALEALKKCRYRSLADEIVDPAITALRSRLAQPEPEPANYKELLNKSEARLHEVAVHCERVERRLREVNTAAMKLTSDLTCMEIDDDDRLSRDRVMERIMQWRNEWDKAMHNSQPQIQPCAGRNCGSTNPNLHSAECFEDYEKATGMNHRKPLTVEEIKKLIHPIVMADLSDEMTDFEIVRAIEAAHGIKES